MLGEVAGIPNQRGDRVRRADRVAGHEHHAVRDAVAQEGAPVGAEEVLHIEAKLEEGERVDPMCPDERERVLSVLPIRKLRRRAQGPEEEIRDRENGRQRRRADGRGQPGELVVEPHRPLRPRQQAAKLTHDVGRLCAARDPDRDAGEGRGRGRDANGDAERRARMQPIVPDVERVAAPPEDPGRSPRDECLLEIEPFQQGEQPESEHQDEGGLPRAPPPRAEVEGGDEECDARGHREGVEERHRLDGLQPQQEVVAPGDVRRQRREQVDEPDSERRGGRKRGQAVRSADRPQRCGAAMEPQPPGRGVALGGDEVTPVLHHEPRTRGCPQPGDEREAPGAGRVTGNDESEHAEAELPLVDAPAQQVDPRSVPMAVEADQGELNPGGEGGSAAATVAQATAGGLSRRMQSGRDRRSSRSTAR